MSTADRSGAPLSGRVALVTGAGSGLGRAYALGLAAAGATVVVNDLGVGLDGRRSGGSPAADVVAEITDLGRRAVASHHDVGDWTQAGAMIDVAFDTFGDLHILVTSAGFLRDRTLAKLSEAEWDAVVRVHLKGQAGPTSHAIARWTAIARTGVSADRSIVHVASASGLRPGFGQANYGAAKLGVVGLSGVAALEGARYGIRANVVAPSARTRMTGGDPALERADGEDDVRYDPAQVAHLIVWLALADCPASGQVLHTDGRRVTVLGLPPRLAWLEDPSGWTVESLDGRLTPLLVEQPDIAELLDGRP